MYDRWDTMIKNVKTIIYKHEGLQPSDFSSFYDVKCNILIDCWNKNDTRFHVLSSFSTFLNPRYLIILYFLSYINLIVYML